MLADLILYLHLVLLILICIAPFRLPAKYLKYYILFILLMILQWKYLGGCFLTNLENKLRKNKPKGLIERINNSCGFIHSDSSTNSVIFILVLVVIIRLFIFNL